jgi:hypothetical protein
MTSLSVRKPVTLSDEDCPIASTIFLPMVLCITMLTIAAITVAVAHVDVHRLLSYFQCAAVTVLWVLVFVFVDVARLAVLRADKPLRIMRSRLVERLPLLLLPAVILPIFLMGYTAAKCAIPYIVGYTWDGFWANVDRSLFGDDVWKIARRLLGTSHEKLLEWLYSFVWATAFLVIANAVAYYGRRRFVGVYFTALLGTWLIGGCLMAYAFSAAGPVFAPAYDPTLFDRFNSVAQLMNSSVGMNPIATSQHYLEIAARSHIAAKGGGISAMPSMHLGTVSVFVLAARRTNWLPLALLFWATIFLGSGYFGYHYWVDGIAAAMVATGCWYAAEWSYAPHRGLSMTFRHNPTLRSA